MKNQELDNEYIWGLFHYHWFPVLSNLVQEIVQYEDIWQCVRIEKERNLNEGFGVSVSSVNEAWYEQVYLQSREILNEVLGSAFVQAVNNVLQSDASFCSYSFHGNRNPSLETPETTEHSGEEFSEDYLQHFRRVVERIESFINCDTYKDLPKYKYSEHTLGKILEMICQVDLNNNPNQGGLGSY